MRTVFLSVLLATTFIVEAGAQESRILREYDRFEDRTTIRTPALAVERVKYRGQEIPDLSVESARGSWATINISVNSTHAGQTIIQRPRFVMLGFGMFSQTHSFGQRPSVIALVDGRRVRLMGATSDLRGQFVEVRATMTDFLSLINGRGVEIQVGEIEFALPDHTLAALREFARELQPVARTFRRRRTR